MKKAHNTRMRLDERLYLCAKNVRLGSTVADIGADHAYLAIWLVLNGVCPRAIATDLRAGPLLNAQKTFLNMALRIKLKLGFLTGLMLFFLPRLRISLLLEWAAS